MSIDGSDILYRALSDMRDDMVNQLADVDNFQPMELCRFYRWGEIDLNISEITQTNNNHYAIRCSLNTSVRHGGYDVDDYVLSGTIEEITQRVKDSEFAGVLFDWIYTIVNKLVMRSENADIEQYVMYLQYEIETFENWLNSNIEIQPVEKRALLNLKLSLQQAQDRLSGKVKREEEERIITCYMPAQPQEEIDAQKALREQQLEEFIKMRLKKRTIFQKIIAFFSKEV